MRTLTKQLPEIVFDVSCRVDCRAWRFDASDRPLLDFGLHWWPNHLRPSLWLSVGPLCLAVGWFALDVSS